MIPVPANTRVWLAAGVTDNRQAEEIVEPTEPGEAIRPETARAAATAPAADPARQPPSELAETSLSAPLASESTAIPMAFAADPVRATPPPSPRDNTPSSEIAATSPVEAAEAPPKDVVEADPGPQQGLQVSRRPQVRPREVERAAAARQSPAPDSSAEMRGTSGSNASRYASRGSTAGRENATATREGRDTTRRSEAQGNAAASNYPGLVMRHLARAPRLAGRQWSGCPSARADGSPRSGLHAPRARCGSTARLSPSCAAPLRFPTPRLAHNAAFR